MPPILIPKILLARPGASPLLLSTPSRSLSASTNTDTGRLFTSFPLLVPPSVFSQCAIACPSTLHARPCARCPSSSNRAPPASTCASHARKYACWCPAEPSLAPGLVGGVDALSQLAALGRVRAVLALEFESARRVLAPAPAAPAITPAAATAVVVAGVVAIGDIDDVDVVVYAGESPADAIPAVVVAEKNGRAGPLPVLATVGVRAVPGAADVIAVARPAAAGPAPTPAGRLAVDVRACVVGDAGVGRGRGRARGREKEGGRRARSASAKSGDEGWVW